MKPYLIGRRCPAQKEMCQAIAACPSQGAIYYVADAEARLGGRILFDYEKCIECGACATQCCGQAIEMR